LYYANLKKNIFKANPDPCPFSSELFSGMTSLARLTIANYYNDLRKYSRIDLSKYAFFQSDIGLYHKSRFITLNRNTFVHMPDSLEQLSLKRTPIRCIEPGVFNHLSNVKQLLLNENKLKEPPFYLNDMPNLEHLSLSKNNISSVDKILSDANDRLITLDLSNNKIEALPNQIAMSRLTVLNLGYNKLTELSENTFTSMPSLVNLDLEWNNIANITPSVFDGLVNLRCLDLSHNNFQMFDFDVLNSKNMPVNLRYLNLASKSLNTVQATADAAFFLKFHNTIVVNVCHRLSNRNSLLAALVKKNCVKLAW
jgi:Leucine-rich repeat (LRR) protein